MADLIANFAAALVWNQPGSLQFWFHYTDPAAARAIVATRTFKVGRRHGREAGIYVCPYQPGSRTEDDLASLILDGSYHQRDKLQAAVVLAAGPDVAFTSDPATRDGLRFLAEAGSDVALPNQVVGWARIIDAEWLHSRSLFDPRRLRELGG